MSNFHDGFFNPQYDQYNTNQFHSYDPYATYTNFSQPNIPVVEHVTVFVGNLSPNTNEQEVIHAFQKNLLGIYGDQYSEDFVVSLKIIYDAKTKTSKGYGFLILRDRLIAETAISHLNMKIELRGKALRVGWSSGTEGPGTMGTAGTVPLGMSAVPLSTSALPVGIESNNHASPIAVIEEKQKQACIEYANLLSNFPNKDAILKYVLDMEIEELKILLKWIKIQVLEDEIFFKQILKTSAIKKRRNGQQIQTTKAPQSIAAMSTPNQPRIDDYRIQWFIHFALWRLKVELSESTHVETPSYPVVNSIPVYETPPIEEPLPVNISPTIPTPEFHVPPLTSVYDQMTIESSSQQVKKKAPAPWAKLKKVKKSNIK